MDSDIIIVGAGVVGCALARVLSRYDCNVVVLEKADDVAEGTSKANSGIVHAGFDAHPGSLKARLNVEGAAMYPALCEELGVPYSRPGALVLGFGEADRATIEKLVKQGAENGVPGVRLIEREEILTMEPNVNGDVVCALYAPTSGLTSPYELTYALADHAALNGVRFERDTELTDVKREGELWRVQTNRGEYRAKVFVNCAGVFAGEVHNMISDTKLNIIYRRGQYYLLDRVTPLPFRMTVFQCPTRMGKGVLVSPTVHGNVLLGPTAEDIPDGGDVSTTADGLASVLQKARLTCAPPSRTSPAFARTRSRTTLSSAGCPARKTPLKLRASRAPAFPPPPPSRRCSAARSRRPWALRKRRTTIPRFPSPSPSMP